MKTYNKIEATLLAMQTAVICASTVGVSTDPVKPDDSGNLPAGARGNVAGGSEFGFDADLI